MNNVVYNGFTWYANNARSTCRCVECPTHSTAKSLAQIYNDAKIPAYIEGAKVRFEGEPDWVTALRVSENALGVSLINRH